MRSFVVTLCFVMLCMTGWSGEGNVKNGSLEIGDNVKAPASWRFFPSEDTLLALRKGLPEGIGCGVKVTVNGTSNNQGSLSQKSPAKVYSGRQVITGFVRSDIPQMAFLQVKLYKGKKELKRVKSSFSKTEWAKLSVEFETGEADAVEILLRWRREARFKGKTACFADIKIAKPVGSIAFVGDSTVQDYPKNSNRRGWGQMLTTMFVEGVQTKNYAAGGRSTKTFREEKRWEKVLSDRPDIVIIQFGHNDSHAKGRPEATDADSDYKQYLVSYVKEAREKGIVPLLVTPPHRRVYKNGKPVKVLQPYADAMKQVAKELNVPVVDLHGITGENFTQIGEKGASDLFCSERDRSHFSEKGALMLAQIIVEKMSESSPEFARLVKK